jgi:hypothetical protein
VAAARWVTQLPRDVDVDASGTQRLFPPEPIVHRRGAKSQARSRTRLPAPGCELLPLDRRSLPTSEKLRESDGGQQAADYSVAFP